MPDPQKKVAFLIYPMFCNYEVALTLALLSAREKAFDVFALTMEPVKSEEGLTFLPDKTLDQFVIDDYDCILLSGIGGWPDPVLYNPAYIDFLRQFQGRDDILIAAMSLFPAMIAQAGLLKGKKFCIGMVEEDREEFHFLEYENQVRAPIVTDGNVITAMEPALREFALEVARKLGYTFRDEVFAPIKYPISPEDYIFHAQ